MNKIGLYIHIPFCKTKCPYCSFFSMPGKNKLWERYFACVATELQQTQSLLKEYEVDTVYFGGGTPTLVPQNAITSLLQTIRNTSRVCEDAEISIEANPETLTTEKLEAYRKAGFNRLSLGLQAWQDEILIKMGRAYTQKDFVQKYKQARASGFKNINIDLMFGLPGQTLEQWQKTLEGVTSLRPEHIACYSLELENGSAWSVLNDMGKMQIPCEILNRNMYRIAVSKLKQAGYDHYEISNWSKPGLKCRHNYNFWNYQPYIGLGAGAHSFCENKRWNNIESIEGYITAINRHGSAHSNDEKLSKRAKLQEKLMLGLRLNEGIIIGPELKSSVHNYEEKVVNMQKNKLIVYKNSKLHLSSKGLSLENTVINYLLADD